MGYRRSNPSGDFCRVDQSLWITKESESVTRLEMEMLEISLLFNNVVNELV